MDPAGGLEYPLSVLFAVTHDLWHLDLQQADIVVVLDYSPASDNAVVRRNNRVIEVPKHFLKRAETVDLKKYFMRLSTSGDSSFSHRHRHRNVKALAMPIRYQVIGHKVLQHGDSFVTVFVILVTPYAAQRSNSNTNNSNINNTPFFNTRDGSWVVLKTQRCLAKLHLKLEQYIGKGSLPFPFQLPGEVECEGDSDAGGSLRENKCDRKPVDWDTDTWLTYRTQAMADYFLEFKNPKRGFYLGNSRPKDALKTPNGYTNNPLLRSVLGVVTHKNEIVVDEFSRQLQEEHEEYQQMKKASNPNKYVSSKGEAYWLKNDAPQLAALDSLKHQTEHLIHGLPCLAQFLHTDKVTLVVSPSLRSNDNKQTLLPSARALLLPPPPGQETHEMVAHFELSDVELITAVQNGEFDISPLTPIDSLLKVWAATGHDRREDHKPAGVDKASWAMTSQWEEPEESLMSTWQIDDDAAEEEKGKMGQDHGGGGIDDNKDAESYEHSEDESIEDSEESSDDDGESNSDFTTSDGDSRPRPRTDSVTTGHVVDGHKRQLTHKQKYAPSRPELFARRAAKAAILGIESEVLRRRLWKGFIESSTNQGPEKGECEERKEEALSVQTHIASIKESLHSIENYVSERQDAHEGLESFAHFGLMILSTAVTFHQDRNASGGMEEDDCSVGSLTAVGPNQSQRGRGYGNQVSSSSSVTGSIGGDDIHSNDQFEESTLSRLNKKIHTLFSEWEKRRETAKERNLLEKQRTKSKQDDPGQEVSSVSVKATPYTSVFVTQVQKSRYKKKVALLSSGRGDEGATASKNNISPTDGTSSTSMKSHYFPYPSQINNLSSLSSSRLTDYISNRTKTRLSRKSERVLIIDRMKLTEKTFQARRLTFDQMRTLLEAIEGADEKQHAALLFIVRLTDVIEIESNWELLKKLEISIECETRIKLVASILSAEARAEDNLSAIHGLYTKCFTLFQHTKEVLSASKQEDSDYARFQSIQKLKDTPLVSTKFQNSMRNKIKACKSDISLVRQSVADVHASLNIGFSTHLSNVRSEQDLIAKKIADFKLIVIQSESVCRMRGTLSSGRPEYLLFHRLKAALACADKARSIAGEVIDEATGLLSAMQKILKTLEDLLASTIKASAALLQQVRDLSAAGGGESSQSRPLNVSPSKVERELEIFLQEGAGGVGEGVSGSTSVMDIKSNIAMLTGLTAACAGAGWRRALQEISKENYAKFQTLISPSGDVNFDSTKEDISKFSSSSDAHSYIEDATYMCLLLSRLPLLRDMININLANKTEGDKRKGGAAIGQVEDVEDDSIRLREGGDSITYDDAFGAEEDRGDDSFSYAVYDETF